MRFIGDIHADFRAWLEIIDGCDTSVQVGDFGIGFGLEPPVVDIKHRFIRGNHDSPEACKASPNWIPDGTVEGKIMFCGGAWSIDQHVRTPGVNWWFDEELNDYEFEAIFENFKEVKPEIMVTHDLPQEVNDLLMPLGRKKYLVNRTNVWLRRMFDFHNPKFWICGHHHPPKGIAEDVNDTTFVVLPINGWFDLEIGV